MNIKNLTRRSLIGGLGLSVIATALNGLLPLPAAAHGNCPFCQLAVIADTKEQDNETGLRIGKRRIDYRCVFCALSDAQAKYKDTDLKVMSPSEKKGSPVVLERKGGKWTAPEGSVFVGVKGSHRNCQTTYRAFTNQAGFEAFVKKNQGLLKDAKPLSLNQMLAVAKGA